jgi:hypothetical protein
MKVKARRRLAARLGKKLVHSFACEIGRSRPRKFEHRLDRFAGINSVRLLSERIKPIRDLCRQ